MPQIYRPAADLLEADLAIRPAAVAVQELAVDPLGLLGHEEANQVGRIGRGGQAPD